MALFSGPYAKSIGLRGSAQARQEGLQATTSVGSFSSQLEASLATDLTRSPARTRRSRRRIRARHGWSSPIGGRPEADLLAGDRSVPSKLPMGNGNVPPWLLTAWGSG